MDVTNNSYYVDPFEFYCDDQPDQDAAKEAVRRAVDLVDRPGRRARRRGRQLGLRPGEQDAHDTSSPDDATPVTRTINSGCEDIPTELDGVVTVSSLQRFPAGTQRQPLSSFSNRGLGKIDVAAPGSTILSTIVADNGYGTKSGTSMASPHVAGVLALMKSVHPTWTPAQMIAKLRSQADDKACGDDHRPALRASVRTRTTATSARASWTPSTRSADPHRTRRRPRHPRGGAASVRRGGRPWGRRVRTDAAPRLPLTPILTHQIRTDDP